MSARRLPFVLVGCLVPAIAAPALAQPAAEVALAPLDDRVVLNPLAAIALDSLSGFRDRPLFVPSRRRPAEPAAYVAPEPEPEPVVDEPLELDAEPELPSVTLAGILEVDSESVAMLHDPDAGTTLSVRVGDPIDAGTVAAIGSDSVTLELDGTQHEIRIFQPGPADDFAGGPVGDAMDYDRPVADGEESFSEEVPPDADAIAEDPDADFLPDETDPDFMGEDDMPIDAGGADGDFIFDAGVDDGAADDFGEEPPFDDGSDMPEDGGG